MPGRKHPWSGCLAHEVAGCNLYSLGGGYLGDFMSMCAQAAVDAEHRLQSER